MSARIEPAFVFLPEDGESLGDRVARCALQLLADGPMSKKLRVAFYREVISCGWDPPLERARTYKNLGQGIEGLATSCGIFVRCVLHWAGRPTVRPGIMGQALVDSPRKGGGRWGWCEGLTPDDEAWMDAEGNELQRGDVLLWGHRKPVGREGHVEIAVKPLGGTLWQVAAGGGGGKGDGTLCRLVDDRDIAGLDAGYRKPLGWWRPSRMSGWLEDAIDTQPAPPPESE